MSAQLVRYEGSSLELVGPAFDLARKIATTEFVPTGLRGRPEAIMACILTGHELQIGPMQALSKIHIIEGKPTISAELMRALVLSRGHDLWIEEENTTRCTIGGRRQTSARETRVTWTMDDARKAGLSGKQIWQKYPRAMLLARATGTLCRGIFADVLAGVSYTSEEMEDGGAVDLDDIRAGRAGEPAEEKPKRRAKAARAATDPAPPAVPAPPLPGEDDDGVEDAELVPDYEGPDQHLEPRALEPGAAIAIRCNELGLDRDGKLRLVGTLVGRQIMSTSELTVDEIKKVLGIIGRDGYEPPPGLKDPKPDDGQPPAQRRRRAADPDAFDAAAWESFCAQKGISIGQLLLEARRLAKEVGTAQPNSVEEIAGKGLGQHLVHWAES